MRIRFRIEHAGMFLPKIMNQNLINNETKRCLITITTHHILSLQTESLCECEETPRPLG